MFILAHRGASNDYLENSISSFKNLESYLIDGVEFDVQLTKDNKLIIFHDYNLKRLTNSTNYIFNLDYDELKKIPLINKEYIPTLDIVMNLLPKNIIINIELKLPSFLNKHKLFAKIIIDFLKKIKNKDNIVISSFNHNLLNEIFLLDNTINLSPIFANEMDNFNKYIDFNFVPYSINLSKEYVSKEIVEFLHFNNNKIWVYSTNTIYEEKFLENLNIDAIFSNIIKKSD
ncbi:glycerophosphoryl diester phosphodiesterase [Hypnocyclicus thermotrophus]|uniref:Glycerophosphoryl diester phosphodiesterase n=1 Tax=Hypnocyclicus thermotrophus TaxID=1627895 RepID=A0AA46DZ98_9FUSO|nr:glycerophosphodiester phosphodiesterase family protein [Hypnocyclicus thermotrophus]TDT71479.1 glycerophosphoryl diester phosphodiesterase [Hypnocyclicus thermotrophus]